LILSLPTELPQGITGGGGEMIAVRATEGSRRPFRRAEDFKPSHKAATRDYWGRMRDNSS